MKSNRQLLYGTGIVAACILAITARVTMWSNDPGVFLLQSESGAEWIRHNVPFNAQAEHDLKPIHVTFQCEFELAKPVANAKISVRAFRACEVWVDADSQTAKLLYQSSSSLDRWKILHEVSLPENLLPGKHVLRIKVGNERAQPCLLAFSRELGIASGKNWSSSFSGVRWKPVSLVNDGEVDFLKAMEEQQGYPSSAKAIRSKGMILVTLFVVGAILSVISTVEISGHFSRAKILATPENLRWILIALWIVMAMNNITRVRSDWGYDLDGHLQYLSFIKFQHRLPLATEGWQTFQSPLSYLIAVPFFFPGAKGANANAAAQLIRVFPLLAGLAQIEWVFRAARTVFPQKKELQSIAVLIGGLMPMNIYMSQAFSNEPIGSTFTSLTILFCFSILTDASPRSRLATAALSGVAWGLALLSKITCVLLAPLILLIVFRQATLGKITKREAGLQFAVIIATASLISGWYFLRNIIYLGTPFVGGWDPRIGIQWWQDPSYRTWNQLLTFGHCLQQPVYSGVTSLWDALYSTMWADGFLMGFNCAAKDCPWNAEWMAVTSLLSVIAMVFIVVGAMYGIWRKNFERPCLLFSVAAIGIYLAALIDLYVHVPVFSQAKASYLLGLLPCFAILCSAGAEPFLRSRFIRPVFWGWLTTWSVSSYFAFFCLR